MLRHLSIRSFALIDHVELDFNKGLTVLVGETGAGKSIIMDALNAALGARLSADSIRANAKKAVIEATFDVSSRPDLESIILQAELDWNPSELILRRELTAAGNSRLFINDTPSTTSIARSIADVLLDFHGQHDTHGLLNTSSHIHVLDAAGSHQDLIHDMEEAFERLQQERLKLQELQLAAQTADEERLRLEYVITELEEVGPVPNEDDQVQTDLRRAEYSEHILATAVHARESVYTGEPSAYDLLKATVNSVTKLLEFNPELATVLEDLESALTTCKETAAWVEPMARVEDFSPEHIDALRLRSGELTRLVKKYGSLDSAIQALDKSRSQLSTLSNLDNAITSQTECVRTAESETTKVASALSKARKKISKPLADAVTTTIQGLGMPKARFEFEVSAATLSRRGIDSVEIMFSANAGEPPKSLGKIASGGELSRVMVALKQALSSSDKAGTLVFDEIDTGISGSTARKVGMLISDVASSHQVICITHLPQIASLANSMIRVTKSEDDGRAMVAVTTVNEDESILEIAKLMSGTEISDAAIKGAKELRFDKSSRVDKH